jgi:hypothetical protein
MAQKGKADLLHSAVNHNYFFNGRPVNEHHKQYDGCCKHPDHAEVKCLSFYYNDYYLLCGSFPPACSRQTCSAKNMNTLRRAGAAPKERAPFDKLRASAQDDKFGLFNKVCSIILLHLSFRALEGQAPRGIHM